MEKVATAEENLSQGSLQALAYKALEFKRQQWQGAGRKDLLPSLSRRPNMSQQQAPTVVHTGDLPKPKVHKLCGQTTTLQGYVWRYDRRGVLVRENPGFLHR